MAGELLIYGANGYTGQLVARRATELGLAPVLAGRNGPALAALARELGRPQRVFGLHDAAGLDAGLRGVAVVLHCAGPFVHTSAPMAEACLRQGAHYLDVTGEAVVFEALRARDAAARAAGVMLLPGAGFDVVPSDCLAAALAARLPDATRLDLAFLALGGVSRGTALTALEHLPSGGLVCRGGKLVAPPRGESRRDVDFGRGPVRCACLPWGDVVTAHESTGIPDVTCWGAVSRAAALALRAGPWLGPLLRRGPLRRAIERRIASRAAGPDAEARARGRGFFWGEAANASGQRVHARLRTPEGYAFTADSATQLARRALASARPGFQTPSRFAGAGFVLTLDGVATEDPWRAAGTGER
jgi:short subunit dehydrogenase-like uncharacterized protein